MKYPVRALVFVLSLLFVAAGCDKKNNPTGAEGGNSEGWQADQSYFRSDKILLDARVSSDSSSFMVAGLGRIALYQTDSADSVRNAFASNDRLMDSRPALSDKYIAYPGKAPTQFIINSPFYWGGSVSNATFPFVRYFRLGETPDYSPLATIRTKGANIPMGAFNNQDQFLTAVSDTANDYSLCLVNLNPQTTYVGYDNIPNLLQMEPEVKYIRFEPEVFHSISYIGAFGENFFVSLTGASNGLIRVTPSGAVQGTSGFTGHVDDMFARGDTLYAYSWGRNKVFRSTDNGLNWTEFLSQFPVPDPRFFFMDGQLCGYVYSQLFKVDLDQQMLVELDNEGLQGDEITSVNKFNNRVWITTLSGMYYKPADQFFQEKTSDSKQKSNLSFRVETR